MWSTGVFKSTDGGGSWRPASTGLPDVSTIQTLVIDPSTPSTIYAGEVPFNGTGGAGVFKSTDAGNTWSSASTGLPNDIGVQTLAIDPSTPGTLYAGTVGAGVFKST